MTFRIILEGADNSGKSTLASFLRDGCPNVEYFHPGGPPADEAGEIACLDEQRSLLFQTRHLIMDRCTAISQQVYNPGSMGAVRSGWLHDALESGVIVVYARPSTDWLMSFENFTWRDGETEEHKKKIIEKQHTFIERYDALMLGVPHVHYDYKGEDAKLVIRHLINALNGDHGSQKFLRCISAYQSKGEKNASH